MLRVYGELEAVAIVKGEDGKGKAEGESLYALFKDLVRATFFALDGIMPRSCAAHSRQGEHRTPRPPRPRLLQAPRLPLPPALNRQGRGADAA